MRTRGRNDKSQDNTVLEHLEGKRHPGRPKRRW
jgi:hypothetical protein